MRAKKNRCKVCKRVLKLGVTKCPLAPHVMLGKITLRPIKTNALHS